MNPRDGWGFLRQFPPRSGLGWRPSPGAIQRAAAAAASPTDSGRRAADRAEDSRISASPRMVPEWFGLRIVRRESSRRMTRSNSECPSAPHPPKKKKKEILSMTRLRAFTFLASRSAIFPVRCSSCNPAVPRVETVIRVSCFWQLLLFGGRFFRKSAWL